MIKAGLIRALREKHDFSQEQMAEMLKVSRPTYAAIEKGKKDLTLSQAQKLAGVFDMSLDQLLSESQTRGVEVVFEKKRGEKPHDEQSLRISVPERNAEKFREVLLYILEKAGNKPNVGMTVLYKLLYFIDFDYFEKFEEQLMGATYMRNHFGPTPVEFKKIVSDLIEKEELVEVKSKYFQKEQKKFIPRRLADLSVLNARELKHIDQELTRLSDLNAHELSELSHKDVPWISAGEGQPLDYEAVFYRSEDTSVREYDEEDHL